MAKGRELVGITDAAKVLGVHPNTLRTWTDRGIVPHTRLPSGYRRYAIADLERFRDAMQSGGEDREERKSGPESKHGTAWNA